LNNYRDFAIVTTLKDFVKLEKFNLKNLYIMDLSIKISQKVDFTALKNYIKSYN